MSIGPVLFVGAAIVAALALGLWWSARLWAVADTPTVPAGHAFPGRIEVRGQARRPPGQAPITSPLTGASCGWWSAEIQEQTDSGKNKDWKRRAIHSSGRVALHDDSGHVIVDLPDTGPIGVILESIAHDELPSISSAQLRRVAQGAPLHDLVPASVGGAEQTLFARIADRALARFSEDLDLSRAGSDWRVIERRIADGDELYILGRAMVTDAGLLLGSGDGVRLLAYRGGEDRLVRRLRGQSRGALAAFVVGTGGLSAAMSGTAGMPKGSTVRWDVPVGLLAAWLALLAVCVLQAVRIRNRIVGAREQVLSSWRLISIADQRRAALVPALNEVVAAAMGHERTTLELLAQARAASEHAAGAPTAEHVTASSSAHEASRRAISIIGEAMPTLHTSANAAHLFDELVAIEDGVAAARAYYRDARTVLADRLGTIPDAWLAPLAGPMPAELPGA